MTELEKVSQYVTRLERLKSLKKEAEELRKAFDEAETALRLLLVQHEALSYGDQVFFLDDHHNIVQMKTISVFQLPEPVPVIVEQEDDGEEEPPVVPQVGDYQFCSDRPDTWHDDDADEYYDEEARRDDEHRIWEGLRA